jgi:hypothetical protein
MDMLNKEQMLYFFLQGKVSLSQYDYKFMANLQTMIQNKSRVTSNQATLFDNLISKYKKQLTKNGLNIEVLKVLPWKTDVIESSEEYTGATISLYDNDLIIRVPFNKPFITNFRNVKNNRFIWDKDNKFYRADFSTTSLKIAYTFLPKYFNSLKLDDTIKALIDNINEYHSEICNPTLCLINNRPFVLAVNEILGELISEMSLNIEAATLFKLSSMGITIHEDVYKNDSRLEFASKRVFEYDIEKVETVISWMKNLGCDNIVIGRGLKTHLHQEKLNELISKYGMNPVGPISYGSLPHGTNMLLQHTSSIDVRNSFNGHISKTVVLKNSQPIEVK